MSEEKKDVEKEEYVTPEIESEELMTFGASCNGSTKGGRKATAGAPNFCNSNKLLS